MLGLLQMTTASAVGSMEGVAAGSLPGLKLFGPTRSENELAGVDDITIQVDLDLPVDQHGMATFHAFHHDAEDPNFTWSVELPVGAVVVPAVSLCGKGQAVAMNVVLSEVYNSMLKSDRKHSPKDGTLLSGSSHVYTSHLEPVLFESWSCKSKMHFHDLRTRFNSAVMAGLRQHHLFSLRRSQRLECTSIDLRGALGLARRSAILANAKK